MKIVFLSDHYPPENRGGAANIAKNLADYLSSNHQIVIITSTQAKIFKKQIYQNIKVFRIPSNYHPLLRHYLALYNPQINYHLKKILIKEKPQVIFAHNLHEHLSYYSLIQAQKLNIPTFLTTHDFMSIAYSKLLPQAKNQVYKISWVKNLKTAKLAFAPFRNSIIRKILNYYPQKIITVSHIVEKILNHNGIFNTTTIYNGIPVPPKLKTTTSIYKRFHLDQKKPIILFAGRISYAKGISCLIKACEQLPHKNWQLVIIGSVSKDLKKNLYHSTIKKHLVVFDWVDHKIMQQIIGISDIIISPSIYIDPFPTINLEAMVAAKPVITTNLGGSQEAVINNQTGFVINPQQISDFTKKIDILLKNSYLRKKMGTAGQKRIKQFFTIRHQADQYLKLYQELPTPNQLQSP